MPNINSMFPSKYLKADDLGQHRPIVTISHVKLAEVGQDGEKKPVCFFEGKGKGLVLNKVNAETIAGLVGSFDIDDWPGHRIRLYATKVEFGGKRVPGIRVDDQYHEPPVNVSHEPENESPSDIPF
jgi:hypothetical protein